MCLHSDTDAVHSNLAPSEAARSSRYRTTCNFASVSLGTIILIVSSTSRVESAWARVRRSRPGLLGGLGLDGNETLLSGVGVEAPWRSVDRRLDTEKTPHESKPEAQAERGTQYARPEYGQLCAAWWGVAALRRRRALNSFLLFAFLLLSAVGKVSANHAGYVSMHERLACAEIANPTQRQSCFDGVARRDYQIGSVNGRFKVDPAMLGEDSAYRRSVLASGRIVSETAFYIGRFAGEHIAVTNRHVVMGRNPRIDCVNWKIRFTFLLGPEAVRCAYVIVSWPQLDLALISLQIDSPEAARVLQENALEFDFASPIRFGQPLLTAGYGGFGNEAHDDLMVNQDADCRVMSPDDTFRLRPVDNPRGASAASWSFALGCDSSPGDSGSAVLDRRSGKVVGVLWTGHTGKPDWIRDSAVLRRRVTQENSGVVWHFLNYATPAPKIREIVLKDLAENRFEERTAEILRVWLSD